MSPRTYQRKIQRLKHLLLAVEWVQPMYNGSPSCSYCGSQQHFGHRAHCVYVKEPMLKRKAHAL